MSEANHTPLRRMQPALGTYVEVGLVLPHPETAHADAAFHAAFAAIEHVQHSLSFHDPDSELSRLNQTCGRDVPMSALALRVLRLAQLMTLRSGGLFNVTLGGALVQRGRLPDHGGALVPIGHAHDVELRAGSARLHRPIRITLDGIAKGYAVDLAVLNLRRHGVRGGWVNAGGDMRAFGDVTLPVQCRASLPNELRFGLRNAALATSATAADYDAAFPGEIIDASLASQAGSWSVITHHAWRADALTKVAALADPKQRESLLHRLGGRSVFMPATMSG